MKTHKRFICPAPRLGVTVLALALLGLAVECRGVEASSDPSAVWVKPDESLQWKTVMSASAALTLNWPSGATSALLTIEADDAVLVQTNITDTAAREALVIPAPLPATYEEERVLDLSIAYRDSGDETLKEETARVGWVTGVDGHATRLIPAASGKDWTKVAKYAVLTIPEDTTAFSVDSASQEYDAPGWWEWRRIASGDHALALTAGGEDFPATLTGGGGGFTIIVR